MDRSKAQKVRYKWDRVDSWMKENPNMSYTEFMTHFPKFPFTNSTYYTRKRRLLGGPSGGASRKTLYETLGVLEMKEVKGMDAITAMRKMLTLMDRQNKTRIEIVRLSEPDALEIRRFTR